MSRTGPDTNNSGMWEILIPQKKNVNYAFFEAAVYKKPQAAVY